MALTKGQKVTVVTEDGEYFAAQVIDAAPEDVWTTPGLTGAVLAVSVQPYAKGEPGVPLPA